MSFNKSVKDEDIMNGLLSLQETVTARFDQVDNQFNQVNNKIDSLEHRMLRRFDDLDARLNEHAVRIA